jgi:hypothetical protein
MHILQALLNLYIDARRRSTRELKEEAKEAAQHDIGNFICFFLL